MKLMLTEKCPQDALDSASEWERLSPALVSSKLKPETQTFAQDHMKCDVTSLILKRPVYIRNKTLRTTNGSPNHSVGETGHPGGTDHSHPVARCAQLRRWSWHIVGAQERSPRLLMIRHERRAQSARHCFSSSTCWLYKMGNHTSCPQENANLWPQLVMK